MRSKHTAYLAVVDTATANETHHVKLQHSINEQDRKFALGKQRTDPCKRPRCGGRTSKLDAQR